MTASTTLAVRSPAVALAVALLLPALAAAAVVRVEITERQVVPLSLEESPAGPYEILKGTIHLEVDPGDSANRRITDLALAPRNARGRVEFSTEIELHKPVDPRRGRRRLIYFVNNRGHKHGADFFSHGMDRNWLYSRGWSYLWCGWIADIPASDRRLNLEVPALTADGEPVTGKVYAEMINFANQPVDSMPLTWGGSLAYPAASLDNASAKLTMRRYRWDEEVEIPRDGWSFARVEDGRPVADPRHLHIHDGFRPGWLYDLVYVARDPKPVGLGLAAIRDVVSFLRYDKADAAGAPNPLAGAVEHVYAWGHSQSARLLNHFVYDGFNGDERRRRVFDGVIGNCGGAGKGQFNSRFAQTTRHGSHHEDQLYPVDFFPFTSVEQRDPVTGERGDNFARARAAGTMPKLFYVNAATDYWTRAASLLHTDVAGTVDAAVDPSVRLYLVSGIAHTSGRIGFLGRALLEALDAWVSDGVEPPASRVPRIDDGTLVSLERLRAAWPAIPGAALPDSFYHPYRLDPGPRWKTQGIADHVPPRTGPRYAALVPQVDADGNEIAGIHLPEVAVPLATYTGWSLRNPEFSRTLRRNAGRSWPLPRTAAERATTRDPRPAILERYPTRARYLLEISKSLMELRRQRLLLAEDVPRLLEQALEQTHWTGPGDVSGQRITAVAAQPPAIPRGGSVRLSVAVDGDLATIRHVRARFREADDWTLHFNDRGRDGDQKAGDGLWTTTFEMPQAAPPAEYHFDVQAMDVDFAVVRAAAESEATIAVSVE